MAVNNTPIGLDLDLQYLCIFGAGKLFEGQAALRAMRLLQNHILMALTEFVFNSATVAGAADLLSALTACRCFRATFAGPALLALGGEEALLQIPHLSEC